MHIKHAKEELVKEIKELREEKHNVDRIFEALSNDEKVPEVLERLRKSEPYEEIAEWLGRSPQEGETFSPRDHHSTFEGSDHDMEGVTSTSFCWTAVTSNTEVLDHLLQLYFAWIHPVHTLFSEGHFTDCYRKHSETYCSSVLVNAICAMACHLHTATEMDEVNYEYLGAEFREAVRAHIASEDTTKVTTIQAFAIMFLVDCAGSSVLRAGTYLKIATKSLPSIQLLPSEGFNEVVKSTFRGIRALNVYVSAQVCYVDSNSFSEWAQATFQVPPTVVAMTFEDDEEYDDGLDREPWYCYRYAKDAPPPWPSIVATTNREKSKLVDIIEDSTTMMYSSNGAHLTARDVLQMYGRFMAWREDLPNSIGQIDSNSGQALPHVLSLL